MYNPAPNSSSNVLEFIEIHNSNPYFEDISSYRISGDIDFTFPTNTILQAGEYRVLARNPAHVMAAHGITGVMGSYSNALRETGTIRLRNKEDAILLEVNYDNSPPWPAAADGAGHSLVLARPSYGEGHVQAWDISDRVGGSPGRYDAVSNSPQRAVVINEFFANSEPPALDYIELYNHSNSEVDLSGCSLSDDPRTNKFVFPANTRIQPRSFLVFNQAALGFGLSSGGETIYFRSADGTRVLDTMRFEAQAVGISAGRHPDGGKEIYPLATRTPGTANAAIRVHDIVINEIMYHPISGLNDDEYVELYNKGSNVLDLSGWRFVSGIDYQFPTNVTLAPGAYAVVAKNAARLIAKYSNLNSNNTFGDFGGALRDSSDRVALAMPDINITTNGAGQVQTNTAYVAVDEVTYDDGGQWGRWADEGGSSLELIDARANHRLAYNWADSDETAKAPWTTIEATGLMDNGSGAASYFEILALNEGEWLVDDVEVIPSGSTNIVSAANSNFEGGQGQWRFRGTHIQSSIDDAGGYGNNGKCLHVRATARGDSLHNRCLVPIAAPGGTITLRAKVRWLRGWPEMLFRLHGNYMEAVGPLLLPSNPGTPGARNSRAISNAPPAIYNVSHSPVVPPANQSVVVTARAHDPDGVSSVSLYYRIDPSTSYSQASMNDSGANGDSVAGDGIYSATIPGQAANAIVAFYVEATDGASVPATISFPRGASPTTPECVVRFGDPITTSSFGTYRQWMTAHYFNVFRNRPALSNERIPLTFVYGDFRAIHLAAVKWAGSPFHQFSGEPNSTGHYSLEMPKDDLFLGTENVNKVHAAGNNPFDDANIQREQACFWFARHLGLSWLYRRCVNMYFNGVRPGGPNQFMEDTEVPGDDVVDSRFPDDAEGNLYKFQNWFEAEDGTARSLAFDYFGLADLIKFTTVSNGVRIPKLARYRQTFHARAVKGSANDYSDVFALIDAADTIGVHHIAKLEAQCDMEQWMRTFAVIHAVGDPDHFGNNAAHNMYGYKPTRGKWNLMIWDMNFVLGNSSDPPGWNLFRTSFVDTNLARIFITPQFRRMYLRALKELCNGPFVPSNLHPMLDSKYSAYLASGVVAASPTNIKAWVADARTSILATVATNDVAGFRLTGTNFITVSNNIVTLTGEAPLEAKTIKINGIEYLITWTSVKDWTIRLPVGAATNNLILQAYDLSGNALSGFTTNVAVYYTGPVAPPDDSIVFNEIMYNPQHANASYVEFYNRNPNFAFDLSGWRVNGLDFTFPDGTIVGGGQYLVIAKDAAVFDDVYGTTNLAAAEFNGNLDLDGETLTLLRPGTTNECDAQSPGCEIVVDKVRYEAQRPWPVDANGSGPSLQLLDPNQESSRAGNWSAAPVITDGWRFVSVTGSSGPGVGGGQMRLLLFLGNELGSAIVDDVSLVAGTNAATGYNYVRNGDFELPLIDNPPLTNNWMLGTNYTNSLIVSGLAHSGNGALKLVAESFGNTVTISASSTNNRVIYQALSPAPAPSTIHTLSFWFWATNSSTNLAVKLVNAPALRAEYTNINISVTASNNLPTPGAPNQNSTTLPPFPPLWINEVQAENVTGILDNNGEREPWIEIFNTSASAVSLEGLYLAASYSNLTQWAFPAGASIGPRQFLVVFADGETGETTGAEYHTNFRLPPGSGTVALSRIYSNGPTVLNGPQVLDYVNYVGLHSDKSFGSFPDGQPFERMEFFYPAPRSTNDGRSAPLQVFINEWMAGNTRVITDPADGDFEDWFELYNPTTNTVDVMGYFLTDVLTERTKYLIATNGPHTIAPRGFLLVWADNETGQNMSGGVPRTDLHVNFQLARAGEAIGLFARDGTQIDAITFTNQTDNVSEGRFPDGNAQIYAMTDATPRLPNSWAGNNVPAFTSTVRNGNNFEMTWGTLAGRRYAIDFKDDLNSPVWTPLVTNTASSFSLGFTNSITTPSQRFFRIRLVD